MCDIHTHAMTHYVPWNPIKLFGRNVAKEGRQQERETIVSNIRHRRSGRDTQAFGAESESNKANAPVQGRQSESRQWRYD
jgi:hypothetical protein